MLDIKCYLILFHDEIFSFIDSILIKRKLYFSLIFSWSWFQRRSSHVDIRPTGNSNQVALKPFDTVHVSSTVRIAFDGRGT